ncbi:heavy metal sensor histidine kinase [Massilia sp. Leaf139]|uniref:heavy metal sensor histidine kinase n=1 Tax=Massilia sp. Leaf139 TaxID=1736272 RepID=UPI0006FE16BA|nr:heavy metal sensor histidine kinase [Massilia sp. Leaf139]KQQ87263.1 histidine kinase [Massilia sp. Leaf139]
MKGSLTLRVSLALILIVASSAAGLGLYLYHAFVGEIVRRDEIALRGKLRQVQQLLATPDAQALLHERPQYFRDTMSGQENALVRILDADGRLLLDINPAGERYPLPSLADGVMQTPILAWSSRAGAPAAVISGSARLGDERAVRVLVARVYADRSAMFARYRNQIVLGCTGAALLAGLLAALMLVRGLRPLRAIAAHAALVRPGRLDSQIDGAQAPRELQPLIAALNAMLVRLHDGYTRLSGFSADLAHEFRTPVNSLLVQMQVALAQPRSAGEIEELLVSNVEELERLARMIDSMLFLARAQQEDVVPVRETLEIGEEFARVAEFFEGMAEEREVRLACSGAGTVQADAQLLRRALANLLSNAIRHAHPGTTVTLAADVRAGHTELIVTNQGDPIGADDLPHLFERFYRADAARSTGAGSTGLGLSIVSAIMALHRGRAEVRTAPGTVSFVLLFPVN